MSLDEWMKNGWLRPHKPSKSEIKNLLDIVDRDLQDASTKGLSDDWAFGIGYNAALKLCTVLLHASGFRPEKNLAHYRTLQALPLILGVKHSDNADYLDVCRKKRNEAEYDLPGTIDRGEATELLEFCDTFKGEVLAWLKANHKDLLP